MVEAYEQYCIDQAEAWLVKVRKTVGYSKRLAKNLMEGAFVMWRRLMEYKEEVSDD